MHSHVWLLATPWTVARQAPLVHGIFQARILEWVAISFSRGSSQPRDQTCISCVFHTGRQVLYQVRHWGHILPIRQSELGIWVTRAWILRPPSGELSGRWCPHSFKVGRRVVMKEIIWSILISLVLFAAHSFLSFSLLSVPASLPSSYPHLFPKAFLTSSLLPKLQNKTSFLITPLDFN